MRTYPLLSVMVCMVLLLAIPDARAAYDFPIADPYVATVIGTPEALRAELPARIPLREREVTVFEDRPVPDILWYNEQLRYSIVTQDGKAPLIFLVPGLGAGYNDPKIQLLQRAFFKAGFHVVCLSSPSHPNFITAASGSGIPGNLREDARDLYRVMRLISCDLRKDVQIAGYHLAGYSLGAAHAAFLAELDDQQGEFRFGRVVMINPPVSMYNSMRNLDEMIKKIPGGEEKFEQFFDQAFKAFSAMYQLNESVDFSGDFLYRGRKPNDENLAALIGLSFRLAVANMAFTSDAFTNAGYIKPKNLELSTTDSLTDYFKVADLVRFTDYFHDILLPSCKEQTPGLTEEQLIEQLSLKSIEPLLRSSSSVFLLHNADDLILAPGEIDYLRKVFGPRARIYPRGGHCGNIDHRENVADMLAIFKDAASAGGAGEKTPEMSDAGCAVPRTVPGESTPPPFTVPRPAAAAALATGEGKKPGAAVRKPGEIVPARRPAIKPGLSYVIDVSDPLEPVNRALYRVNATLDEYLVLPLTRGYEFVTPVFVQDRVSDLFSNVSDIRNFANALLQLRPRRTAEIFTRFLINTTLGLGGMWDPATRLGFTRHIEDFGQTLGWYGLKGGPYLVLPLLGPSNLRDTAGLAADGAAQYFYLTEPTDMDRNIEWGIAYEGMYLIDKRHNVPFRYYQTGSPFEYDLLRLLYTKKREVDIEQ
ncbi:MAG TPA: alpha/beta fold hydrolase [Geobacteraceae bacterium]